MSDTQYFEEIDDLPIETDGQVKFNTAILTYPSDFNDFLSVGIITEHLEHLLGKKKIKVVIAREDADNKIQRNHFHCYIDSQRRLQISPRKYFDIKLPHKLVVFIRYDKSRFYRDFDELASELGWDTDHEMVAKLSSYCEQNDLDSFDVLETAHPNLQVKRAYGSKYQMLRYVVKQGLVSRSNFDVRKELEYLKEHEVQIKDAMTQLIQEGKLKQIRLDITEELKHLCEDFIKKEKRKNTKDAKAEREFMEWLRVSVNEQNLTQPEITQQILNTPEYWYVYAKNYLNWSKVIENMIKRKIFKPVPTFKNHIWYLPRKLYDYIQWLDKWIEEWVTAKKTSQRQKKQSDRIKGLVLIGETRTGKTELLLSLGLYTYICNMWSMDQWENAMPFTIMDDIDPNSDPTKGLNFAWYKGFFGAQKAVIMTDKYRSKKIVPNGKPLIWINNNPIESVFTAASDQRYIQKNMVMIDIGSRSLYEKPNPPEWIEGHSDYVEYDSHQCWYYQNVVLPKLEEERKEAEEEEEPLSERKRRLSIDPVDPETEEGRLCYKKIKEKLIFLKRSEIKNLELELEQEWLNLNQLDRLASTINKAIDKLNKKSFKDFDDYLEIQFRLDDHYYNLTLVEKKLVDSENKCNQINDLLNQCNQELKILINYY